MSRVTTHVDVSACGEKEGGQRKCEAGPSVKG